MHTLAAYAYTCSICRHMQHIHTHAACACTCSICMHVQHTHVMALHDMLARLLRLLSLTDPSSRELRSRSLLSKTGSLEDGRVVTKITGTRLSSLAGLIPPPLLPTTPAQHWDGHEPFMALAHLNRGAWTIHGPCPQLRGHSSFWRLTPRSELGLTPSYCHRCGGSSPQAKIRI